MSKTEFASVQDYIDAQPEAAREVLQKVRNAIMTAVPRAEEKIKYRMPLYQFPGGGHISVAGWKRHYSLYFASERVVEAFKDELSHAEVQKGTISFPLSDPVPVDLIQRIARFRAADVERT